MMSFPKLLRALALPTLSVTLVLFPVVTSIRALGFRGVLNVFAPDAMYYAAIANNFARFGFPTSDGMTTTNGFQPLWGWSLMLIVKVLRVPHDQQLELLFGLSAACVACAYGILASAFSRLLGRFGGLVAVLTLFPGLYATLYEPVSRYAGEGGLLYALDPWSAINGVESPAVILTWSLLLLSLARNYRIRLAAAEPGKLRLGDYIPRSARWCLAAILLCRLEQGLLFIAIAAASVRVPARSWTLRLRGLVTVLWPAGLIGASYVAFNMITVGAPLPVSGLSKVSLGLAGGLAGNLHAVWQVMRGTLGATWWLASGRLYPLLFGGCAGAALLVAGWNALEVPRIIDFYLVMCGVFLLLNTGFLFVFEPIYSIGYWYFWPVALVPGVLFSLQLGVWARGWAKGRTRASQRRRLVCILACASILLFRIPNELYLLMSTDVAALFPISDHQRMTAQLWAARRAIRSDILRRYPDAKLVEPFDGVFGFVLDLPARSFTGLISSPVELARRHRFGFWRSAVEDGFDIVPDFGYIDMAKAAEHIQIVDRFLPPGSPVVFYRVKLR